ncbi:MAG: helix-turn-helix domain-containing protein [Gammaproteobacteria bacterium]
MLDLEQIAARLKAAREAAGFKTSRAFCDAFDIPRSTYSQHESGQFSLKDPVLKNYAEYLQVNFDWLKFGEGEPLNIKDNKRKTKLTSTLKKGEMITDIIEKRYSVLPVDETLMAILLEELLNYSDGRAKKLTNKQMASAAAQLYDHLRKTENDLTLRRKMTKLAIETYFHLSAKKTG